MLRSTTKYGWVAIVLAGLLMGCSPPSNVNRNDAAQDATAAEARQARAAARREIQNQIDDLDRQIAKLREDAAKAGNHAEDTWNQSVADLQKRTEDLRREWDSLQDKSDDAWDAFSQRAKRAIDEIEVGLKEAKDKLG
jgi:prefoldin subunit 5